MKKLAYTIQEAESASGIRKDLLYAEINRGNLKTLKIGRRRLSNGVKGVGCIRKPAFRRRASYSFGEDFQSDNEKSNRCLTV